VGSAPPESEQASLAASQAMQLTGLLSLPVTVQVQNDKAGSMAELATAGEAGSFVAGNLVSLRRRPTVNSVVSM
jgi:hypothetical protein